MSIKRQRLYPRNFQFEIDVILDEYQTMRTTTRQWQRFEIDVILDEYQTD